MFIIIHIKNLELLTPILIFLLEKIFLIYKFLIIQINYNNELIMNKY